MAEAQLETHVANGSDGTEKGANHASKQARRAENSPPRPHADRVAKLKTDKELDAEQVAKLLEELASGVRSGKVLAKSDEQELALESTGTGHVRLKAHSGRKRSRLFVRICWTRNQPTARPAATPRLSENPVPEASRFGRIYISPTR